MNRNLKLVVNNTNHKQVEEKYFFEKTLALTLFWTLTLPRLGYLLRPAAVPGP